MPGTDSWPYGSDLAGILSFWRVAIPGSGKQRDDIRWAPEPPLLLFPLTGCSIKFGLVADSVPSQALAAQCGQGATVIVWES